MHLLSDAKQNSDSKHLAGVVGAALNRVERPKMILCRASLAKRSNSALPNSDRLENKTVRKVPRESTEAAVRLARTRTKEYLSRKTRQAKHPPSTIDDELRNQRKLRVERL
jgi:hypothetical protein